MPWINSLCYFTAQQDEVFKYISSHAAVDACATQEGILSARVICMHAHNVLQV